ncbi:MAG: glycoside hydrolase family 99-like domain-containing protein [Anaerolineae bacterium]
MLLRLLSMGVTLLLLVGCAPRPAGAEPQAIAAAALAATAVKATATVHATPSSTATTTATRTATTTHTRTAAPSPSPSATPSATPSPTAAPSATVTPTAEPTPSPTAEPSPIVQPPAQAAPTGERLLLANYFAWYDGDGWSDCNISDGDRPAPTYSSDDPEAIGRQVRTALEAGIDGFTLQWFAPGERTDANLGHLLSRSEGTSFRSTTIVLRHIWPGSPAATQSSLVDSLRYLLEGPAKHPNWLTIGGKPIVMFADMQRVPRAAGQTAQDAWAAIRAQVDPDRRTLWIAEGLDPSYLAVFDGLYVYKITHAAYPDDYVKAGRWAGQARAWSERTGQTKQWWATITPGWDDLRATCRADIRVPSSPHKRDRQDGAFYQATMDAALASQPDVVWINSWNEFVEGTYIEPSERYGDRYLALTREFARRFKGS